MKNLIKHLLPCSVILLFFAASCNKGDDGPATDTAGKGGNAILKITPRHHGNQIDSCTIYVKYNAVDAPVNGRYDDSAKCILTGGIPVATFSGLKKGNYYLYGYGWDPSLCATGCRKGWVCLPAPEGYRAAL